MMVQPRAGNAGDKVHHQGGGRNRGSTQRTHCKPQPRSSRAKEAQGTSYEALSAYALSLLSIRRIILCTTEKHGSVLHRWLLMSRNKWIRARVFSPGR